MREDQRGEAQCLMAWTLAATRVSDALTLRKESPISLSSGWAFSWYNIHKTRGRGGEGMTQRPIRRALAAREWRAEKRSA